MLCCIRMPLTIALLSEIWKDIFQIVKQQNTHGKAAEKIWAVCRVEIHNCKGLRKEKNIVGYVVCQAIYQMYQHMLTARHPFHFFCLTYSHKLFPINQQFKMIIFCTSAQKHNLHLNQQKSVKNCPSYPSIPFPHPSYQSLFCQQIIYSFICRVQNSENAPEIVK